ncbi:hypothetical protein H0W80_02025 [Candidatus Saccharibacteria bacterium]|nr:hypothetical protein [Candidatus Saccharibacteria bacterium]
MPSADEPVQDDSTSGTEPRADIHLADEIKPLIARRSVKQPTNEAPFNQQQIEHLSRVALAAGVSPEELAERLGKVAERLPQVPDVTNQESEDLPPAS